MPIQRLSIPTEGEGFYTITEEVRRGLACALEGAGNQTGMLSLFVPHTSCGLTINESYAPEAARDLEAFLKHLAPRDLPFIQHDDEGPDDSPSHMKSLVLPPTLTLFVEEGQLQMGQWQGIFLCEFRDAPRTRELWLKFVGD